MTAFSYLEWLDLPGRWRGDVTGTDGFISSVETRKLSKMPLQASDTKANLNGELFRKIFWGVSHPTYISECWPNIRTTLSNTVQRQHKVQPVKWVPHLINTLLNITAAFMEVRFITLLLYWTDFARFNQVTHVCLMSNHTLWLISAFSGNAQLHRLYETVTWLIIYYYAFFPNYLQRQYQYPSSSTDTNIVLHFIPFFSTAFGVIALHFNRLPTTRVLTSQ